MSFSAVTNLFVRSSATALNFTCFYKKPIKTLLAMRFTTLCILLLSITAFVLGQKNGANDIIQLTDANFDAIVGDSDEWLVEL
jgi:hypothetical protein